MILLILALLPPLAVAYLIVCWCWPEAPRLGARVVLKLSLAFGLSMGLCSCSFFLRAVLFPAAGQGYLHGETILSLLLFTALAVALRIGWAEPAPTHGPTTDLPVAWRWVLRAGFALTALAGLTAAVTWLALSPHGDWDGWAIWNIHARFLYRGGEHWTDYLTLDLDWSHPDYPLLMPANVARLWTYAGKESTFEHRLLDLIFLLATCGLLGGALARLRGSSQGLLSVMILATTPLFLEKGSSQYSDIPLGYFLLATVVLLCLHEVGRGHGRLVMLAGAAAGFAAWTKNEGLLFLLAVLVARAIVVIRLQGWRAWGKEGLAFGLGALPTIACLVYFKMRLAPPNDLVAGQGLEPTLERLLTPSRYGHIASAFALQTLLIGPGTVVALAVYFILLGKAPPTEHRAGRNTAPLVVALVLAGYALIYLATPNDLVWHLGVLDRLFMQVWPLALFGFFLAVASPEEALARKRKQTIERTSV